MHQNQMQKTTSLEQSDLRLLQAGDKDSEADLCLLIDPDLLIDLVNLELAEVLQLAVTTMIAPGVTVIQVELDVQTLLAKTEA